MKHPSSREFFAYWDRKRDDACAPDRSEIEPASLRELLADIFVLAYDASRGFPFRVAGTRVCALFGHDMKERSFTALFTEESRGEIEEIVAAVGDEMLPAIAGLTATACGATTHLELLLLPFNNRAHTPVSLTGLLAPFETSHGTLGELRLASWRYIHPPPQKILPRALRKLAIARGFIVYEGLS